MGKYPIPFLILKNIYIKNMTELSKIAQNYYTDKGVTYYNSHCYTEIYDSYFKELKNENRKVYILEIGIQSGYDLLMINDYFEGNCEIYGIDINLNNLEIELPNNIHVFEFDAANLKNLTDFYKKFQTWSIIKLPQFDIIIDDGSHNSIDILTSLSFFYNKLSKNGIYIIEDLHANTAKDALYYLTFNENKCNVQMDNVTNKIKSNIIYYNYDSYCNDFKCSICAILRFNNTKHI